MNSNYGGYFGNCSSKNICLSNDAPKKGKKGKTLKCWERNGFYNRK